MTPKIQLIKGLATVLLSLSPLTGFSQNDLTTKNRNDLTAKDMQAIELRNPIPIYTLSTQDYFSINNKKATEYKIVGTGQFACDERNKAYFNYRGNSANLFHLPINTEAIVETRFTSGFYTDMCMGTALIPKIKK